MAIKIGSLVIQLAVEHGILQQGLSKAERDVAKTTKAIQRKAREVADFAAKMSLAVSVPVAAIAKASIDGAIAQRQAVAQVESALASMGQVANRTAAQLIANADALEMRSLFDADVILKQVTANLLTFGNVAGREFDRAQQAALDMATRLGSEPQAAAIQLGKALNDPIRGLTALGKTGAITRDWIAANQTRIAGMVQEGRIADAQGLILAELEREYRGAAAAAADASPYRQFQVILGQIGDTIGEALLPKILELRDAVMRNRDSILAAVQSAIEFGGTLVQVVRTLSPLIAGFAAYRLTLMAATAAKAAYTTAMILGTRAIAAAQAGTIGLNAALASNPFGAVAVAVGTLTATFVGLANAQRHARAETDNLIASLKAAAQARSADFASARTKASLELNRVRDERGGLEARRNALLRGAGINPQDYESRNLTRLQQDRLRGISGALQNVNGLLAENGRLLVGLESQIELADEAYERAGKAAESIAVPTAKAAGLIRDIGSAAQGSAGGFRDLGSASNESRQQIETLLDRLFPAAAKAKKLREELNLINSSALSEDEKSAARFRLRTEGLGDAYVSPWLTRNEAIIDLQEQSAKALEEMADKTETQTVRIAQTYAQMVESVLGQVRRLVDGIRGGDFLSIVEGLTGIFTQLGSTGLFGKSLQASLQGIPGNANGTAYHPGGLMKVGERGPEILMAPRGSRVVPNHELRGAAQTARAHVTVGIDPRNGNVTAFVNNQIATAAPLIANLGAGQALAAAAQSRRRMVR